MKPQVLILAPANDVHASAVRWALAHNNAEAVWAPSFRLDDFAKLTFLAGADGVRMVPGSHLDPVRLRAVWGKLITLPQAGACVEGDRHFIEKQWEYFQKNAFDLASELIDALWVNQPSAAAAAESKLLQLKVAHEVNLSFPETVLSNDVKAVRELLHRCGRLIFKQFYGYAWKSRSTGEMHACNPALIDEHSALPDVSIAMCPGIYQCYVDKIYDVRVTIIGERIFPVRLWRKTKVAYLDWRPHIYDEDMCVEPFELPGEIERSLRLLMRRLGLVLGCVDLVADREGRLHFLEVNQQGQFLFVEEAVPQFPLLQAMTALLLQGRTDYVLDAVARVPFADYLRDADYQQVLDAPRVPSDTFAIEA